jgi:tRNA A-37 threonylcarbamoyl transferase component Bud32
MEWCGDILCESNKPQNVYEQLYNIHIVLLKNGCFYNDWKWGNFLVKDDKITIIDFGWCPTIMEDYSCNGKVITTLKEKPAGNYFQNVLVKE